MVKLKTGFAADSMALTFIDAVVSSDRLRAPTKTRDFEEGFERVFR
jgi:hypothetical protein